MQTTVLVLTRQIDANTGEQELDTLGLPMSDDGRVGPSGTVASITHGSGETQVTLNTDDFIGAAGYDPGSGNAVNRDADRPVYAGNPLREQLERLRGRRNGRANPGHRRW